MDALVVSARPNLAMRTAIGAGAGCIALAIWNPGDHGTPVCPTKLLTGLDCPLCGGLRCVAQLTRGHIGRAADHNLLVVVLAPFIVAYWIAWWLAERTGRARPKVRLNRWGWIAVAAVVVAFTVVRNLPIAGFPRWLNSAAS